MPHFSDFLGGCGCVGEDGCRSIRGQHMTGNPELNTYTSEQPRVAVSALRRVKNLTLNVLKVQRMVPAFCIITKEFP